MKLLINGIPGMGKTTLGNYLEQEQGFIHVDMELQQNISAYNLNPNQFISNLLSKPKVVITWGFRPFEDESYILDIISKGFKPIWFDGNRESAHREFSRRSPGDTYENAFQYQLMRINTSKIVDKINPKIINTFNESGDFKDIKAIVVEVTDAYDFETI